MATSSEMSESEFNDAVATELEQRDRPNVAEMSREFDTGMGSMSASTVAREENYMLCEKAVGEVADLREYWHDEHYVNQGETDE